VKHNCAHSEITPLSLPVIDCRCAATPAILPYQVRARLSASGPGPLNRCAGRRKTIQFHYEPPAAKREAQ
jgi:hypothetical protein